MSELIDQGWSVMNSNTAQASRVFEQALDLNASDPDANFGFGYARALLGDLAGARPHLCKALAAGGGDTKREAQAVLNSHELSCDQGGL